VSYDVDSFFDVTSQGARLSGLTWLYSLAKADGSSFFFKMRQSALRWSFVKSRHMITHPTHLLVRVTRPDFDAKLEGEFRAFYCPGGATGFSPGFQPWEAFNFNASAGRRILSQREQHESSQARSAWVAHH
jgi:hypothetical protein